MVIENFKLGGLAKYGLDYASLSALNPRLVYCSITGFGQTGPYAAHAGYDFIVQGMSGVMDLTGDPDGTPQKIGVAYADIMTGLYATIAIQGALAERERSGLGQHLDMSRFDVMVASLANQAMNYLASGDAPRRLGNQHPNIAPYEVFATADSWIILAVGNDAQFTRACEVLGLMPGTEYATNPQRVAHRAELRGDHPQRDARGQSDQIPHDQPFHRHQHAALQRAVTQHAPKIAAHAGRAGHQHRRPYPRQADDLPGGQQRREKKYGRE